MGSLSAPEPKARPGVAILPPARPGALGSVLRSHTQERGAGVQGSARGARGPRGPGPLGLWGPGRVRGGSGTGRGQAAGGPGPWTLRAWRLGARARAGGRAGGGPWTRRQAADGQAPRLRLPPPRPVPRSPAEAGAAGDGGGAPAAQVPGTGRGGGAQARSARGRCAWRGAGRGTGPGALGHRAPGWAFGAGGARGRPGARSRGPVWGASRRGLTDERHPPRGPRESPRVDRGAPATSVPFDSGLSTSLAGSSGYPVATRSRGEVGPRGPAPT